MQTKVESNLSLDEVAALRLVTSCTSIKDLLNAAMLGFSQTDTIIAQDIANVCSLAITTYLS